MASALGRAVRLVLAKGRREIAGDSGQLRRAPGNPRRRRWRPGRRTARSRGRRRRAGPRAALVPGTVRTVTREPVGLAKKSSTRVGHQRHRVGELPLEEALDRLRRREPVEAVGPLVCARNRVTVNEPSRLAIAIIMNPPRGQMCSALGSSAGAVRAGRDRELLVAVVEEAPGEVVALPPLQLARAPRRRRRRRRSRRRGGAPERLARGGVDAERRRPASHIDVAARAARSGSRTFAGRSAASSSDRLSAARENELIAWPSVPYGWKASGPCDGMDHPAAQRDGDRRIRSSRPSRASACRPRAEIARLIERPASDAAGRADRAGARSPRPGDPPGRAARPSASRPAPRRPRRTIGHRRAQRLRSRRCPTRHTS